jgi:hypothetical protein
MPETTIVLARPRSLTKDALASPNGKHAVLGASKLIEAVLIMGATGFHVRGGGLGSWVAGSHSGSRSAGRDFAAGTHRFHCPLTPALRPIEVRAEGLHPHPGTAFSLRGERRPAACTAQSGAAAEGWTPVLGRVPGVISSCCQATWKTAPSATRGIAPSSANRGEHE